LRKAYKIKALIIFIAWLIIFAHSVIPHNHLLDSFKGHYAPFHEFAEGADNCNMPSNFERQPEETKVCHFSNFLFKQFNQDNVLISATSEAHFYYAGLSVSIHINRTEPFLIRPYYGSSSLRAPPAA